MAVEIILSFSVQGDHARRIPPSVMGGHETECAFQQIVYRPTLGVPSAHLDARPVHMATADYEDPFRPTRDGIAQTLCQPHRLSQYWVRPIYIFMLILLFNTDSKQPSKYPILTYLFKIHLLE